jgi:outer membrane immunogenic protein
VGLRGRAGVEYKFAQNWSVKGEYLYVGLGNITTVSQITPFIANGDITHYHRDIHLHVARVGVNYQFGGPAVVARY